MYKYLISLLLFIPFTGDLFAQSSEEVIADSLSNIEHYEEANQIYKRLLEQASNEGNGNTYFAMSVKYAINLQRADDYDLSKIILQKALESEGQKNDKDSILALAYHKLGVAFYYGDYDDTKAIQNWEKSLSIRKLIYPQYHSDIVKGLKNIGNSYINLGEIDKAKFKLENALSLLLNQTQKDSILLAETYSELGYLNTQTQDFSLAKNYLYSALPLYENLYPHEPWELVYIYENIYDYYSKLKDFPKMKIYPQRFLQLYEGVRDKFDEDFWNIANAYNSLAKTYEMEDSLRLAINYYAKAIKINEQFGENRKKSLEGNFLNLSFLHRKQNKYLKALETIQKANDLVDKKNDPIGNAEILNSMGVILAGLNRENEGLEKINDAIKYIKVKNKILDKPLYLLILSDKLSLFWKLYQTKQDPAILLKAQIVCEQLVDVIEDLRTDFQSDASKQILTTKVKPIFEKIIQTYLALDKETENSSFKIKAFQIAEKSKALTLLDALNEAETNQTLNIPKDFLKRLNDCKKEIANLEKKDFQEVDKNVKEELVHLHIKLEKLTDTLQRQYPEYFQLKYANEEIDISEFQSNLQGNLIEYFTGDSTIYTFILSNQSTNIEIIEIPLDFPLQTWVKNLRTGLYSTFVDNERADAKHKAYADTLVTAAYNLYQKLIKPITDKVKLSEQLTIIPDGILGYIPFEVLLKSKPKNNQYYGSMDYLINDHQISYSYSAILLMEMQQKQLATAINGFLGVAPSFDEISVTKPLITQRNTRGELTPLDFNIPEVEAIQALVGGKTLIGKAAQQATFLKAATTAKFIHLATHGKANDQKGDYAYLAFAKTDKKEDQFLYNRDLYTIPLNAEMVVLSACETGIGELQKGEGIISLARGFSYAGAKSIITTLWSINDEKSKELMLQFYKNLKEGQSKDMALRQAKLDFIRQYSHRAHPFFWAAFIPIGDMSAVQLETSINWYYLLIPILLLGVLGGVFLKRR